MIWAAVLTLASYHVGADPGRFNRVNPGLGIERTAGARSIGVGVYQNSEWRVSTYAVLGYERGGRVSFGVQVGIATGYRWPVLPIVAPYVRVKFGAGFSVRILALPARRPILGAQLVRSLGRR